MLYISLLNLKLVNSFVEGKYVKLIRQELEKDTSVLQEIPDKKCMHYQHKL